MNSKQSSTSAQSHRTTSSASTHWTWSPGQNRGLHCDNVTLKIYSAHIDEKFIIEETATRIQKFDLPCDILTTFINKMCIHGSLEDVEGARKLIYLTRPFCIEFKLPLISELDESVFNMIEKHFNVNIEVNFLLETVVQIKGCEKEAIQVMDATTFLINYLYEYAVIEKDRIVALQMDVQISVKHHDFIKRVIDATKAWIVFPNIFDPTSNKSKVDIIGANINEMYEARQELLRNFPITLSFNFPNDKFSILNKIVIAVGIKYDNIKIFVDKKQTKQNATALSIWGMEKDIDTIYKSYNEIMNLKTYTEIHARYREF